MNIKTTLKSSVAAAALFAIAAPVAPSVNAADDTLKSGNKNSMTISGYVARAIWYADDGRSDAVFNTDGSTSTSRIRWIASGTMNENVTAGSMVELAFPRSNNQANMGLSGSLAAGLGDGPEISDSAWAIRHTFVWVNHKKMGKISLGQTNAASNGRSETSFSGTTMADLSSGTPLGDGINFINTDNGAAAGSISAVTVGSAFTNLDGRGRTDVLRYDTPRFSGLGLATSYIAGGDWDIAADYKGKTAGVSVRVQAQYNNSNAGQSVGDTTITKSAWSMSGAFLHDGGINASGAVGKADLGGVGQPAGRDAPTFYNFTVGYRAKIFSAGGTNISFNWNHTEGQAADNSEGDAVGFTIGQLFNSIGANMALVYRNYSFDTTDNTFDDVDVFGVQTVFNF